jgi:hypothetical protein
MKRLPDTHPLHKDVFEALLDGEYITRKHRIQIINVEMAGEWGTIEVNTIRPRCRKPSHYFKLAVFLPSGTVFWSKSEHYAL